MTIPSTNPNHSPALYDLVIVGAGPCGLNAALYAVRKGLHTLVLAERIGGQVHDTSSVENYLGTPHTTGNDLANAFKEHLQSYPVTMMEFVKITSFEPGTPNHVLGLSNGKAVEAKAVIIATGSTPKTLDVPGEAELRGRGVCYCTICDAPLYEGAEVFVAGGGNSAIESAIDLSTIAEKVTLVHRSQPRADAVLMADLTSRANVNILLETQIQSITGDEMGVTGITILDKTTGETAHLDGEGIFVEIGHTPNTDPFTEHLALNEKGEIRVDETMATSLPGVYAAGDVTQVPYKQISIAVGQGAIAALAVNDYLNALNR